jgi:chromosome segregation ATPase
MNAAMPAIERAREALRDAELHHERCRGLAEDAAASIHTYPDRLEGFRRDKRDAALLVTAARKHLAKILRAYKEKGDDLMAALDALEAKRSNAQFERDLAKEGVERSKRNVKRPPEPTKPVGPMVTIGSRECHEQDYNTVNRLWREEYKHAQGRLREIDGEIARVKRSKGGK